MDWKSFPREHTPCILCGADRPVVLSVRKTWPVSKCPACGLVYLSDRPSERSLADLYGASYYEDGDVGYKGYTATFERFEPVFRKIFDRRAGDLARVTDGRRLLEVGCAYGFLLDHLRSKGWQTRGIEVSPLSAEAARRDLGLDVFTGKLEECPWDDSAFDVILMLDVLEHLHRPFDTLARASRLLAPGGVLVVQCPWELSHWEEVAQAVLRGMKPMTIEPDAIPAHLYFFNPGTLEAVLGKGGFVVTRRQSGNYGEIRRRLDPPAVRIGSPAETALRFVYYRCGLQRLLYGMARRVGLGNGIIRYAVPCSKPPF
jgi:2-polyprenyl-3-methyl-5-hydroxy-6-metoxy-1,4-benzoquinol methylase